MNTSRRPPWGCVPPKRSRRVFWYPTAAAEVREMFLSGMDTNDIARHFRLHESEIVRALDAARKWARKEAA
jgi:hypothetical protein